MAYTLTPFNPSTPYQNQVATELNTANTNFTILGQAFYNNDPSSNPVLRASYVGSSAPSNPVAGTTWLDTSTTPPVLKVYDGSNWKSNVANANTVNNFPASLTPAPNTIVPLNSSGILDLSNAYIKSNVYTFRRVDLTNASSDYMLQVGEEAIINFSNASNVPLHIATQSGTYYEMDAVLSNNVGTSSGSSNPIYLNPNNTTYSNAFNGVNIYRNTGDSSVSSSTDTVSAFKIGWAVSSIRAYVVNFTTNKHTTVLYSQTGVSGTPTIVVNACYWNDTSTAWTSLGTITFPQSSSGYILVRRLA
ncbi:MAG: hypothetical protein JHC31_12500 [Sulfurihydrogenibium sp.]|jgi:hypothetical protein|nr:hypothetical protein [Sulfurihydrogenibium sp.]